MAHASNARTDAGCPCASDRPTALFKPFEWVEGEGLSSSLQSHAVFLNDARDVVQGAQTLVQLLGWDEDRRDAASSDTEPAPLFDACQRSSLQRFLAVSLGLLHARIEAQCEALTE
ncbi:hypothetical protein CKY39_29375 [Variovorax boronicumulans]|uniref:Uncharacterized protein n=1 Tax=Variovorax boronicumulans TaxID=436515 RepID=A0A250DR97_9BURK|nr:hypothetical protein [Variovorax boronicumulans]ATA56877.1 hypothetical protein CKY39_29375 [Variovorax boronicumulans]